MRGLPTPGRALVALALLGGACTGAPPEVLLVPEEVPTDATGTYAAEGAPDGWPACAEALTWDAEPTATSLVVPWGRTVLLVGERNANPVSWVCEWTADGQLVHDDSLAATGTDRPVGNDYVQRAGAVLGRVDVGIPQDAVTAVYATGRGDVRYAVEGQQVLHLHAVDRGEDAWVMGEVTFLDADGGDVTPASPEIPDVIHGVPRDRGSGVDDGTDDAGG